MYHWVSLYLKTRFSRRCGRMNDKTSAGASFPPENGARTISIQQSPHTPIGSEVLLATKRISEQHRELLRYRAHFVFRNSKWRAHSVRISLQEREDAGLRTANQALVHVAQGVVQWPESVKVSGCNRLDIAAGLEHVHALPGEGKVHLNALRLTVKKFCRDAVEQNNGSCERPVAVIMALVC